MKNPEYNDLSEGVREVTIFFEKEQRKYTMYTKNAFKKLRPNDTYKVWKVDEEYQKGDYVLCDDGWIVPVLRTKRYDNKFQYSLFVRFIFSTIPITYSKKTGKIYWRNNYGALAYATSNNIKQNPVRKVKDVVVYYFALLIARGMEPYKAFEMVTNSSIQQNSYFYNAVLKKFDLIKLLTHPITIGVIMNSINPFWKELCEKIPDSKIVDELLSALEKSKKGSKEHLATIEKVMELKYKGFGYITPDTPAQLTGAPQNRLTEKTEAEEASFFDVENTLPPSDE